MRAVYMFLCLLVLSSCGVTAKERIYNELEKAASLEQTFEHEQQPLVKLEQKEKEIYYQIISLGMHETQKRKDLSLQAQSLLDEREKHLKKERSCLLASKEEFEKVKPLMNKLSEESLRTKAHAVLDTMQKRYDIYDSLYAQYKGALQKDRELYKLLETGILQLEQVEQKINEINDSYAEVLKLNQAFNEHTEQYNDVKEAFYKESGLIIKVEKEG